MPKLSFDHFFVRAVHIIRLDNFFNPLDNFLIPLDNFLIPLDSFLTPLDSFLTPLDNFILLDNFLIPLDSYLNPLDNFLIPNAVYGKLGLLSLGKVSSHCTHYPGLFLILFSL